MYIVLVLWNIIIIILYKYEGCMINSWTLIIVKAIDDKHV